MKKEFFALVLMVVVVAPAYGKITRAETQWFGGLYATFKTSMTSEEADDWSQIKLKSQGKRDSYVVWAPVLLTCTGLGVPPGAFPCARNTAHQVIEGTYNYCSKIISPSRYVGFLSDMYDTDTGCMWICVPPGGGY